MTAKGGRMRCHPTGRGCRHRIRTCRQRRCYRGGGCQCRRSRLQGHSNSRAYVSGVDTKFGHRNDPQGYARALEELDSFVPALLAGLREGDVLMVTADHGGDPSDVSTDHTREFVPMVAAGPRVRAGADVGTRATFADLGATVAEHLGVPPLAGASFLSAILRG